MGEVLKIKGVAEIKGSDATAQIVAWLREQADAIEKGKVRPVHKAVLTVYEDRNEQFRINSAFCNVSGLERIGLMHAALTDLTNVTNA